MARKNPSPYDNDPGFVQGKQNPISNGWVILYDGEESGFTTEDGRWQCLCIEHGSMACETAKIRAQKMMKAPETWCKTCKRKKDEKLRPLRPISQKPETEESREREMRLWAKKAKNNPEKCRLFEQMYGVKPDGYWD